MKTLLSVLSAVRAAVDPPAVVYSKDPAVQKLVLKMMNELRRRKTADTHYKVKKVAAINDHRVVFKCLKLQKGVKTGEKTWVAVKSLRLDKKENSNPSGNSSRNKVRRRSDQRSAEVELEVLRDMLNTVDTDGQQQQPPGIVPILDSFYSKNFLFVVTPWIDGGDLYERVNAVADNELDSKMEIEVMTNWFCQIVKSLAVVHKKGYAHRDLSPENVLIANDGSVKLHDFGLACDASRQNMVAGKLLYAAPEVFGASLQSSYDPRAADIWSLAIVLFIMLTKHAPMGSAQNKDPHFQMYRRGPASFVKLLLEELKLERTMSKDATDLFLKMAKENPAERLTIHEVLQHPFVLRRVPKSECTERPRKVLTRSLSMPCQGTLKRACMDIVGNLIKERKINSRLTPSRHTFSSRPPLTLTLT